MPIAASVSLTGQKFPKKQKTEFPAFDTDEGVEVWSEGGPWSGGCCAVTVLGDIRKHARFLDGEGTSPPRRPKGGATAFKKLTFCEGRRERVEEEREG